MESLDFMTFVRTVLDPYHALDKFEVGSIQIAPTEWPTAPRRIENSDTCGKKESRVLQQTKKNSAHAQATLEKSCQKNSTHAQTTLGKSCQKNATDQSTLDKSCRVKINHKAGSSASCGSTPMVVVLPVDDPNTFLDVKLEASKRKLREQYDKIENEKKKRRIQIVEFQKPPAVQIQPKAKKPLVRKKMPTQRNGLQLVHPAATQLHRTHHVSVC